MFDADPQTALQKYNGWRAEILLPEWRRDSEKFVEDESFEDFQPPKDTIVGDES